MEYLRKCFVGLLWTRPGAQEQADLEACGGAGAEGVVIVTDAADVRVQVRPLLRETDVRLGIGQC